MPYQKKITLKLTQLTTSGSFYGGYYKENGPPIDVGKPGHYVLANLLVIGIAAVFILRKNLRS